MTRPIIRVATDVGGTFTDLVLSTTDPESGEQAIHSLKVDTTPADFSRGVLNALGATGIDLAEIAILAHGSTVVINALTERKGVKTGLITTAGFRDVLEIARGNRPDFFNLRYRKPPPFVRRAWRRELPGRLNPDGSERMPLDLALLPGILADFAAQGIAAVAICLLHAYANPAHEQAVATEIRRLRPDLPVVASHEITREWREYERSSTTVLSAYVKPIVDAYVGRLEIALAQQDFGGRLYLMQSNGGVETAAAIRQAPITMVESGPASGFLGAAELGRLIGEPNILALDIGGTTAKCALIQEGAARLTSDYWIERSRRSAGYPIMVPVVDLVEVGNGGGSIARVDMHGHLRVGPESAGADPGPAGYGKGGPATTTDAHLVLGRIDAARFHGGATADLAAAARAVDALATPLGLDREATARGILRIANANMANALKLVSLNRGHDPRDFTLVAFGGGGGLHAAELAQDLGCRRIVIPAEAAVFSAWGMLMSDLRRDIVQSKLMELRAGALPALVEALADLRKELEDRFAADGIPDSQRQFTAAIRLRYRDQEHSLERVLPDRLSLDALLADFHAAYEREFTYRLDVPVELTGIRMTGFADIGRPAPRCLPESDRLVETARTGERPVGFLERTAKTAIYDQARLAPGMSAAGPAMVERPDTAVLVPEGHRFKVDRFGNILIEREEAKT